VPLPVRLASINMWYVADGLVAVMDSGQLVTLVLRRYVVIGDSYVKPFGV